MCKTDEKTRQYFFYCATKSPTEAEKIWFAKTHDELIIDFAGQKLLKPNTTVFHSCTMTANIWEKTTKN